MKKRIVTLLLALGLAVSLAACGAKDQGTANKKLVVGATPNPHQEILEFVKPKLAEEGIELEIKSFTDYVVPNNALNGKEIDANFFQHQPYLTDFNAKNGTNLISAGSVHFEPLGIYPGKSASLDNVPEGAEIGVPNDATNEARALKLLESQGLIKLKEGAGLNATPLDIVENPKNIKIRELEANQVPLSIKDMDFGVINGNFALQASLIDSVLITEGAESDAAKEYANILAIRPEDKDKEEIKALIKVLTSEDTKTFMEEKYGITVVPVF